MMGLKMRLIDADELKKIVEDEFAGVCVYDVSSSEVINDFHDIIDKASTVKAEPVRHGHWVSCNEEAFVSLDKNGCPEESCYCGVCEEWLAASDEYAVKGRYCPNCGAKMI